MPILKQPPYLGAQGPVIVPLNLVYYTFGVNKQHLRLVLSQVGGQMVYIELTKKCSRPDKITVLNTELRVL